MGVSGTAYDEFETDERVAKSAGGSSGSTGAAGSGFQPEWEPWQAQLSRYSAAGACSFRF